MRDDRPGREGGVERPTGPGSAHGTGGESHGEDMDMRLEQDGDEDDVDQLTESSQPDTGRDDVIPFDKESRLSDAPPDEEPAG